jgi:hypothetical protein
MKRHTTRESGDVGVGLVDAVRSVQGIAREARTITRE